MADRPLRGQKALVTGANSGIGEGVALALGAAGADVVVNYVSNPEAAGAFWLKNSGLIKGMIHSGIKNGEIHFVDETLALFSLVSLPIYLAFAQPVVEIIRGESGYSRAYVRKVARHAVGLLFDNGAREVQ